MTVKKPENMEANSTPIQAQIIAEWEQNIDAQLREVTVRSHLPRYVHFSIPLALSMAQKARLAIYPSAVEDIIRMYRDEGWTVSLQGFTLPETNQSGRWGALTLKFE